MPFVQKILQEINCPRCNAIAQIRYEDRENSVIIILRCNKCRLIKNLGLTTRKAINLKKRQKKLRESLNQVKNPHVRAKIQKEINLLDKKIQHSELGI